MDPVQPQPVANAAENVQPLSFCSLGLSEENVEGGWGRPDETPNASPRIHLSESSILIASLASQTHACAGAMMSNFNVLEEDEILSSIRVGHHLNAK
jgi:hypothetical protein